MKSKKLIYITLVILLAAIATAAYFYLQPRSVPGEEYKVYTAEDFPQALSKLSAERIAESVAELNEEYRFLKEEDRIYIRWINIGIIKDRLKDHLGAAEAWQNAISYNPDISMAYGNLAQLYFYDLQDYEKAEELYKEAIDASPTNYNYYVSLATLYRYKLTEKRDLIESLMLQGVIKSPEENDADFYAYLADYFGKEGSDLEKAEEYIQKALAIKPDYKDQLPDLYVE